MLFEPWGIAAHSDYEMFSKYIVTYCQCGFSNLSFWSGNFF